MKNDDQSSLFPEIVEEQKKAKGDAQRDRMAKRSQEQSESARDIGKLPAVVNPARKASCKFDLKLFCETYFKEACHLGWSTDHLTVLAALQDTILQGGTVAVAMPRGNGKTTLSWIAAIWAILYGHCRYVVIIGAKERQAKKIAYNIRTQIEVKEILNEDFPEVCFPVRGLEHSPQRANGQMVAGKFTHMTWTGLQLVFPTIEGSACSGAVIEAAGLGGGGIRGNQHTTVSGEVVRPDFALIDDPQTKESARSHDQSQQLEEIIKADVMGMAGPDVGLSAVMACTVIQEGDLSDRMLNRDLNPDWCGIKCRLMESLPADDVMDLWGEYWQLRVNLMRGGKKRKEANRIAGEFYIEHRKEMDKGAEPNWEQRFLQKQGEISAIQFAMHIFMGNRAAFFSEYQNEPESDRDDVKILKAEDIAEKLNQLPRYVVPKNHTYLTVGIDCGEDNLFYTVGAFQKDFTSAVVDHGIYPKQDRKYLACKDIQNTFTTIYGEMTVETHLHKALTDLIDELMERPWLDESGTEIHIGKILIDRGFKSSTIDEFCRKSKHKAIVEPCRGKGIKTQKPFAQYDKKKDEIVGDNWVIYTTKKKSTVRHVTIDTNVWKSFVHERLDSGEMDTGRLQFWGDDSYTHKMIAEHLTCEYPTWMQSEWGERFVWELKPNRKDNHLLDTIVYMMVAASRIGVVLDGVMVPKEKKKKKRKSYSSIEEYNAEMEKRRKRKRDS